MWVSLHRAHCTTLIHRHPLDVFYGLTAVRVLSIIALLLTFAGSIVTLVSDVRAVNRSQHDAHSSDGTCGYIGYACSLR
jgi:tellurite resistance protein TehA-like permease